LGNKLLNDLINKNPESVKIFMEKYNKKIFALAYRFTNNYDDALDIIQEAWLNFFSSLKNFKKKSSLYTYLYKITLNEALKFIKKQKIHKFLSFTKLKVINSSTPESIYIENEKLLSIQNAIQKLPKKQKKVFILRNQENISFKEIAEILKIKENNAKTLYFYALQKIKKYLRGIEK